MKVARLAVENAGLSYDILYSYAVPAELADAVKIGARVSVSFGHGKKNRQGFVFSVSEEESAENLKPVCAVLDKEPPLSESLISLAVWLHDRYFCTYFEAARAMLPTGLYYNIDLCFSAVASKIDESYDLPAESKRIYDYLLRAGEPVSEKKLCDVFGYAGTCPPLTGLEKDGFAERDSRAERRVGDATVKTAALSVSDEELDRILPSLSPKQKAVCEVLRDAGTASVKELCYFSGAGAGVVANLVKKGIAEIYEEEIFRRPYEESGDGDRTPFVLTDEQEAAYKKFENLLLSQKPAAGLLFGVTGSGKTKVYMKLIDTCLDSGRGVILMVPEISLTPQALSIFYSRYGRRVAVVHSALSVGERLDEWKRIKSGEADVVIGTRSAVFAPLKNPGLIIIDEEQEHTYKAEMAPRYDAREVSKKRAVDCGALMLLVSATPSVESYTAAKAGKYTLATLTNRYGSAVLPEVITVDMTDRQSLLSGAISEELAEGLKNTLSEKKQALILLNRRGFNTFVACNSCKKVLSCPNCSVSLTYHSANNRLMCHYCGYSRSVPDVCPECGEKTIRYSGFGTQRVEEELKTLFPEARVLRMDADTTMAKSSHEKKLRQFAQGDYDILLGTQMVAKGLDFPNVTFVGVIGVDAQLCNDDYRSAERCFDLLMQVVGRSGRGDEKGIAMIQTISPDNDMIRLAAMQDYEAYYELEMNIRKMMIYPPFCDLCVIGFSGLKEDYVRKAAFDTLAILKQKNDEKYGGQKLIVLGPTPSKILKISNKFRYRIIIKCRNSARFREMIREVMSDFVKDSRHKDIKIYADINPENMI